MACGCKGNKNKTTSTNSSKNKVIKKTIIKPTDKK